MGYKVTGAAAVVEMDDGNPELGTGRRVYLENDAAVPSDAKDAHVKHLLAIGLIEKSTARSSDQAPRQSSYDGTSAPAKSGSKADWVDWAVKVEGVAPDSDEAKTLGEMTRDELADGYADRTPAAPVT